MSSDGRFVVFESLDEQIVDCDGSTNRDAFVLDRDFDRDGVFDEATDRVVDWVSVSSHFLGGAGESFVTSISADGQVVSFSSTAPLAPADMDASTDIYIRSGIQEFASTYCTAKTNSLGCVPYCTFSGVPSQSQPVPPFVITAHDVLANKNGIPFFGHCARSTPFFGGTLCVDSPTQRAPVRDSGGTTGCSGTYDFDVTQLIQTSSVLEPGVEMFVQFWSRDPASATTIGLTDAVRLRIQP